MKLLHFVLAFIGILAITSDTYAGNWRPGEKQVLIEISSPKQIEQLKKWDINFEIVNTEKVRAYVVSKELTNLIQTGFTVKTEIEDLKKHFENFWLAEDAYHSYQEIIDLADSLETEFPSICKKYIFGTSLGGRQLAALKISDNVETDEPEPEVMFDGGIHGDEIGAAENVIRFARDICIDYGSNPTITNLIDNREIWLYLMVNPDGRVAVSRYNNNGVDLNRDWGYMWDGWGNSTGAYSQPESKALRECMYNNQFVVHTTYHSGTEYISLPWSYRSSQPLDWNHIYQLGGVYSSVSGYPNLEYGQGNTGMYAINGSTKDSNYGIMGSISWSMEISSNKQPPASDILMYYNRNYPSMVAMIEYSGYGLDGIITDINTGTPIAGVVFVNDYLPTFSDSTAGDYHKYVLPGTYSITVVANGYESQTINNVVVTDNNSTTTNFQMQPEDGKYVYKFSASRIPGNNEADEGNTPAVIGAPDDINYSLGVNGWCVLDMQYPIADGAGPDLRVCEGDASPEGFTCYVGETIDGPWINIGTGNGITEFDIATSGLPEAQFVKIIDDGDGSSNVDNAGFDLDAIEVIEPVSGIYLAMTEYVVDDSGGNNNGNIDPGETIDIFVSLKNNGDITAENIEGVISCSSPYITIISANANFGNLAQGETAQAVYTILVDDITPLAESFMLTLNVSSNSGAYTNSFDMSFVVGIIIEDWETGDFNKYPWTSSGNADWFLTSSNPFEGVYSAQSGDIGDNQTSELLISLEVTANDTISFYRKVSSESSYDYLRFYIDGSMLDQWAGEVSWGQVSYPVSAGLHSFRWEYYKDGSVSNGSDCGWIDYIIFPPFHISVPPDINISPDSFYVTLSPDETTTEILTIANYGEEDLSFNITTEPVEKSYVKDVNKGEEIFGSWDGGTWTGGARDRGNLYHVTSAKTLTEMKFYLNIPTSTELYFFVYEGDALSGMFTKIDEIYISNSGTGQGWYSSGTLTVDLLENKYYYIGTSWSGSATYGRGNESVPITTSFGTLETGMPGSMAGYPPSASFNNTNSDESPYYQALVTSDEPSWIVPGASSGIIAGSDSLNINILFDATGLTDGSYSKNLIITSNDPDEPQVTIPCTLEVFSGIAVNLKAYLEGPFAGVNMSTGLNSSGYLPLAQPYNTTPWNYTGTESVAAIPNANVVDWVLVELRETTGGAASATPSTMIDRQAGFVLNEGTIVGIDGASPLRFGDEIADNLFVVIYHLNHIGIMSDNAVTLSGGQYNYDFTIGAGQVYGGVDAHKEVASGVWGMMAGDANGDGEVDNKDKDDVWEPQLGTSGYLSGDFDMNGQVESVDKTGKWEANAGKCSHIVK